MAFFHKNNIGMHSLCNPLRRVRVSVCSFIQKFKCKIQFYLAIVYNNSKGCSYEHTYFLLYSSQWVHNKLHLITKIKRMKDFQPNKTLFIDWVFVNFSANNFLFTDSVVKPILDLQNTFFIDSKHMHLIKYADCYSSLLCFLNQMRRGRSNSSAFNMAGFRFHA